MTAAPDAFSLLPARNKMFPPLASSTPSPQFNEMFPDLPLALMPVRIMIFPEEAFLDAPVASRRSPDCDRLAVPVSMDI